MHSHFRYHVFFCCNQRPEGETCCDRLGATALMNHARDRIHALGLKGAGQIRINKSGCLGRCDYGPVLVVYPEAVWYTVIDTADVEEIIQTHLIGGQVVTRLQLPD